MSLKRAVDILVSAALLVLLAPVFAGLALAIWFESGLPVFYTQLRMGRGFETFAIRKFRTMHNDLSGPPITAKGDARVTRLGRLLRATKLDELPQFWNVLRGDMSLVGPRPELPLYVELFHERYEKILTVPPGITDLASIRFRNEEAVLGCSADPLREYVARVLPAKMDLADEYLQKRSLRLDLAILLRTFFATLKVS
jgi:lipopolysaccharide/colanic/teichoic acid biosynthesis glycosyltransferase